MSDVEQSTPTDPDEAAYMQLIANDWWNTILPVWMALRASLKERPGWRFEIDGPHWCYGLAGARRIIIDPLDRTYVRVFIPGQDKEHSLLPDQIAWWLDRNEADFAGFTPLQQEIIAEEINRDYERGWDGPPQG